MIDFIIEDLMSKIGAQKVSSSIRGTWFPVYAQRDDRGVARHRAVMKKIRKNLQKKPYSSDPPVMGISQDK